MGKYDEFVDCNDRQPDEDIKRRITIKVRNTSNRCAILNLHKIISWLLINDR
jgi:hypothetical protein